MSTVLSTPTTDKYPPVNNHSVFQSGKTIYTLKHPDNTSGATVPVTIHIGAIFEIFDHHDVIQRLTDITTELKRAPGLQQVLQVLECSCSWGWPPFWDTILELYCILSNIVSLTDLNITRHASGGSSLLTQPAAIDAKPKHKHFPPKSASHHKCHSLLSTLASAGYAHHPPSSPKVLIDHFPVLVSNALITTGLATFAHQKTRKMEEHQRCQAKKKAKETERHDERKKSKRVTVWKQNYADHELNQPHPSDEHITMIDSDQPLTSKTIGA
ncbi:hypothetical protein M413DRAFT_12447 [Hebeloma cylindrosporum]|uniref:Uncharacterized protein n=1 Tax=Hebeloma cylindrosporum TaxID=76867 RepID=A0A0C3BR95_HEBCY|nr:hypothetical protein M413DRAFT_12447 [Hebeloma cylindrosporum h7]